MEKGEVVQLYAAPRRRVSRKRAQRRRWLMVPLAVFMWASSFTVLLLGAEKLAELLGLVSRL